MSGASLPTILTSAGAQPTPPATLLQWLIQLVTTGQDQYGNTIANPVPGYTANLPGSLIEDISSTDVAAMSVIDQARVESINSISPYTANPFILTQLGNGYGIPQGTSANGSVNLLFTGTVGFVISVGFVASDGTNYFTVQDGGIIETSGTSQLLTAIAQNAGTFAIPANSVTQLITSVPSGITLSVTNPEAGTPATSAETVDAYRARVVQAGQVACQGTAPFLKTLLQAIPGVVPQQVSVRSVTGGWEVIVGGGDAYAIANAIYQAVPNLSEVVGSTMSVTAISQANPGQVTTLLNHGYTTGQQVYFNDLGGMIELNSDTVTGLTLDTAGSGGTAGTYDLGFSGGGGSGAAGTYTIDSSGVVSSVSLTAGGYDFSSAPSVSLSSGGITGASVTATVGTLYFTATVVDEKNFTIGVNTSSYTAFTTGGYVLPNLRNVTVTINDYPDTYSITFVQPPQQTVNVQFTWNTDAPNFVAGSSVAQLGVPAIVNYINSIPVGAPINLFEMQAAFQQAVSSILATPLITRMVETVSINNIETAPTTGTGLIAGDPESYFYATAATVTVTQG